MSSDSSRAGDKAPLPEVSIETLKTPLARIDPFCHREQFGTEKTLN